MMHVAPIVFGSRSGRGRSREPAHDMGKVPVPHLHSEGEALVSESSIRISMLLSGTNAALQSKVNSGSVLAFLFLARLQSFLGLSPTD